MRTPDRRRGEIKELKKDQQVRRDALDEIAPAILQEGAAPTYRNPNRDQARGDWDRSRRHADEETSLDSGDIGDEPVPD